MGMSLQDSWYVVLHCFLGTSTNRGESVWRIEPGQVLTFTLRGVGGVTLLLVFTILLGNIFAGLARDDVNTQLRNPSCPLPARNCRKVCTFFHRKSYRPGNDFHQYLSLMITNKYTPYIIINTKIYHNQNQPTCSFLQFSWGTFLHCLS